MAFFDDVQNLFKPLTNFPSLKAPIPQVTGTPTVQIPYAPTYKPTYVPPKWGDASSKISEIIAELVTQNKAAPGTDLTGSLAKIGAFAGIETSIGLLEEFTPSAAFIISQLFAAISEAVLSPNFRDLDYQANFARPNRILTFQDSVQALFRGALSEEDFRAEVRKEGFNEEGAKRIYEISKNLLNFGELIEARYRGVIKTDEEFTTRAYKLGYDAIESVQGLELRRPLFSILQAIEMWRRGIVPTGDVDAFDDLRKQGYTEERIAALKSTSYTLPNIFNIQDFNVRRVDDPAIVEKFKLDAFIDETYFTKAKALGYSREDAQRIYRYYWEYPPFFQVARLFSNGKIPESDFRDVLGFLRFTPYWVDKLVDDLKPALTEADIKDMYKYQVISEDDIVPELLKIGKTQELADKTKLLWVASVKLAGSQDKTAAQEAADKIKGETAGLIKTAYTDGVITAQQARDHFTSIGYTSDIIDLEMAIADHNIQQNHVKSTITMVKEAVQAGIMDSNTALTTVSEAGASADQLSLLSVELNKLTTHKPVIPTKAEFEAWFKAGIISAADLANGLSLNGIDNTWLPFYLQKAGIQPAAIQSLLQ